MQELKRTRYSTMHSINGHTAPAYNLKIRNVVDRNLQDSAYNLLTTEEFYPVINQYVYDFDREHDHQWQAGMNGRMGGWLVLYKGGYAVRTLYPEDGFKGDDDMQYSDLAGWLNRQEAEERGLLNYKHKEIFTRTSTVDDDEVPEEVENSFRKLAEDIVRTTEDLAENYDVEEETEHRPHQINVLKPK